MAILQALGGLQEENNDAMPILEEVSRHDNDELVRIVAKQMLTTPSGDKPKKLDKSVYLEQAPKQAQSIASQSRIRERTCKKCGDSDWEYDDYWKEYTCKKCGWIAQNDLGK